MTSEELFSIVSKQWANVNDIKILASCGRDKASQIRDNIIDNIRKNNKFLPISKKKIVPMSNVIEYLNLDVNYILLMAENERKLNLISNTLY